MRGQKDDAAPYLSPGVMRGELEEDRFHKDIREAYEEADDEMVAINKEMRTRREKAAPESFSSQER